MTAIAYEFGPRVTTGGTEFRIWAPAGNVAAVEIAGQPPVPMRPAGEGWMTAEAPCGPGAQYCFRLDDGRRIPDPASRWQSAGVHGLSTVTTPEDYAWKTTAWRGRPWAEAVIYELHAGLMGGYAGIAEYLPRLAEMGITAIELMPLSEFAGDRNWGYDGVLPYAPKSVYGSRRDLKALIDRAHELGLMVFLDVVYNHFGPDGNWLAAYAPTFFRHDRETPWGAAIDFREAAVGRYFIENALQWIHEFRFDGLRFDAVQTIATQSWLPELAGAIRATLPAGRHVHLILENETNNAALLETSFTAQWNDDFHNAMHVLLTGENHSYYRDFSQGTTEKLARCLAEGFAYQGDQSIHRRYARGSSSGHLPTTAFVSFLQNHDQIGNRALGDRLTILAPRAALEAAIALLLLMPQIPMLFMGEEVGAEAPFLFFTDFDGDLADAVREGRRREFSGGAGFEGEVPDPNARGTFDRSRIDFSSEEAEGWRDFYRRLLALRHGEIVPRMSGARALGATVLADRAVLARWRMGDGRILALATNLSSVPVEAALPGENPMWGLSPDRGILPAQMTLAWLLPDA